MTSKLDYLKKYLVAPAASSDVKATQPAVDGVVRKKRKKIDKVASVSGLDQSSLRIRDLSEDLLPTVQKDRKKKTPKDFLASELAGARPDEVDQIEFVDAVAVEEAQKIEVEKSGVTWHISQHQKKGKSSGFAKREAPTGSRPVVKQEDGASDEDLSPPRAARSKTVKEEDDLSPPRGRPPARAKQEKPVEADADLSPPRAGAKTAKATVEVKPQRARHDSDSDLSPPRAKGTKEKEQAPAKKRHDSDSDLSPPRAAEPKARTRHDSDSDLSPPRAAAKENKATRKRHDSDSDLSPPRADGKSNKEPEEEVDKMSSGLSSGLVKGSDLKAEAAKVRAERRAAVEALPDEETGKGATTVYRNREGKRIEREAWVEQQQKKKKKKASDYPEQELEWGGGLKQRDKNEAEAEELSRIAAQPFARFEPDQKYMEELKAKQDWNDPMRKQEETEETAPELRKDNVAASEGPKKRPQCPHQPWPNRYGIKPGYRWDGKVRGNGYERKWLEAKSGAARKQNERWQYEMQEM
mmetsp:Transcript_46268/g.83380  ORF Transcript_46268/g.83380 Transcript_46268/m.83380 type:complete len:524 (+) Transcript_46268:3-1574(+)|eukprot:CAMPEP_0197624930 /NCGR_PEP_ID=MMETSP1338-20131121/4423_1 /TAXON_ID=43686 ORGANISM="Pelagodinium beii, Strain RCC1491" /NCGR_SAMPLE_ID=MMETSP1338 /ASSEMBLY_ACC=CAM_ASM_000754 /LENGTH=523 /DNA_ID=CAMNT_0043195191 /DNA_START=1 /DNA_END=1572 /DNA_ORIENTATION=+